MISMLQLLLAASIVAPVGEVVEKTDNRTRSYPGRVVAIQRVEVVPQVSAEILEVAFQNGAVVKEGDVLYRLDPAKYQAAVKNAEARLAESKANAKYAELSYERHKKLLESRAVSLDAVDNALSQRDSSRAAYAAAQADLVAAKEDLDHCTIIAPISGKIGTTVKTKGNYVTAGSSSLVTLVQNHPIRVRFSISNREFLDLFDGRNRRLHTESRVTLRLANGEAYDEVGTVEYSDNEADEETDTVLVYVNFPNDARKLKVGGTVEVTLSTAKGAMRLAVPATAVLQDTQGPYVWVVGKGGLAERRAVARGDLSEDGWMFIEKGLKAGERIVTDGAHKIKRGMTVEAAK